MKKRKKGSVSGLLRLGFASRRQRWWWWWSELGASASARGKKGGYLLRMCARARLVGWLRKYRKTDKWERSCCGWSLFTHGNRVAMENYTNSALSFSFFSYEEVKEEGKRVEGGERGLAWHVRLAGREGKSPIAKFPSLFEVNSRPSKLERGGGEGKATTIVGRKGKRGKRAHEKEISFPEKRDSAGGGREEKGGSDAFLFPLLSPPSTTLPFPPRESV